MHKYLQFSYKILLFYFKRLKTNSYKETNKSLHMSSVYIEFVSLQILCSYD